MARHRRFLIRSVLVLSLLIPVGAFSFARVQGVVDSVGYAWGDFDGDGTADLVIGVPGESIGSSKVRAGSVHVIYGASAARDQVWHQDVGGIDGVAESGDGFGTSVAVGDFNGDGVDDLAIGVPNEDVGSKFDAGVIQVINGVESIGLRAAGARMIHQGTVGVAGNVESGDQFGWSLARGDFNGDGVDDLAVGVPGEGVGSIAHAGVIQTLTGHDNFGLSGAGGVTISQNTRGVPGGAEKLDRFGHSLAVGDFDLSPQDDLAIGVPFEDIGSKKDAGAVFAISGSPGGLDADTTHLMTEDTLYTPPEAAAFDYLGFSLAAGNFDPDHSAFDDLAIGAPGNLKNHPGAVTVVHGSDNGFVDVGEVWFQGMAGPNGGAVGGTRQVGDRFGYALIANDFSNDGAADLAIGVPGEDIGSIRDAGVVQILYSDGTGLDPLVGPTQTFHQNSSGVPGKAERDDRFGDALSSGDYNGDGEADLAVGAPHEDFGGKDAGVVTFLFHDTEVEKLSAVASVLFGESSPGIIGNSETNDRFSASLG